MASPRQVTTSTVKKSIPVRTAICAAIKSFQVVVWLRFGAGAIPCRRRMFPTVLIANGMTEIRKSSDDAVVAPGRILSRHAHDQVGYFSRNGGTANRIAILRSVELTGDEPTVPGEDCFRSNDNGDLRKCFPAQPFANFRQSRPLRVGQSQTLRQLRPENPIFGDQILVLQEQLLVHQPRNIRQKTNHFVVDHRERPSSQIKANTRVLVLSPYGHENYFRLHDTRP